MKLSHIHVQVKDLTQAVTWMEKTLDLRPNFQNQGMASYGMGSLALVIDKSDINSECTIALVSEDCEKDFSRAQTRGAEVIEKPAEQSWGVKTCYLKGPGQLTFEFEEILK